MTSLMYGLGSVETGAPGTVRLRDGLRKGHE